MRTAVLRSVTLALVAFASAPSLVGCVASEDADPESSESAIIQKLPAANARPFMDPTANAEELAFLKKLNEHRARTGYMTFDYDTNRQVRAELAPLRLSIGLTKAARKHSQDMAARNVVPATHHDGGKADKNAQGKFLDAAFDAARARIKAEYKLDECEPGETPCGPSWGEDVSRVIDGTAATAWDLMKTGLIDNPSRDAFLELGAPTGDDSKSNMMAPWWTDVGIGRAKGSNGSWYWTITYGWDDQHENAGLSLDDSAAHSLLSNGIFGLPLKDEDGFDNYGKGSYANPAKWEHPGSVRYWHFNAEGGGSVKPFIDFPVGNPNRAAQGVRIVDTGELESTSHAVQLVRAVPGVNYEVQAKTRKVGTEPGQFQQSLQLDFTDASFKRLGITTVAAGTSPGWTTVKVSATAPAGAVYARVVLLGGNDERNQSTYDWDDVRLRAW